MRIDENLDVFDHEDNYVTGDELLVKLADQCREDSRRWFPTIVESLPHHALAMFGEMGELANMIKKVERGDKSFADGTSFFQEAQEELVDVFIYLLNMAALMNVDLLQGYIIKRQKNEARWGDNARV